jgi:hypothetical protein
MEHSQGNDQVKRANQSILKGIKTRMDMEGASWVDELPSVLWAYRTMPRVGTQETPFSLTYGSEAVIPSKIGIPSKRTLNANTVNNDEELRRNLDLLEERRDKAADNTMKYKTKMAEYYNRLSGRARSKLEITLCATTMLVKPRPRSNLDLNKRPLSC